MTTKRADSTRTVAAKRKTIERRIIRKTYAKNGGRF